MSRGTNAVWQTLRASTFAAVALLIAAGAHLAAGGRIEASALPVALVITLCAAAVLARRTRGLLPILATLTALQVVLHELFMGGGAALMPTGPSGHHGLATVDGAHTHAAAMTSGASMAHTSPPMLLAHLLAVVLTALLLARAESGLRALWSLLRLRAPRRLAPPRPMPRPAAAPPVLALPGPLCVLLDVTRRGPPARVSVA